MGAKGLHVFGRILGGGKDGPQNRRHKDHGANGKGPVHRGGNFALWRGSRHPQGAHQPGQITGNPRADSYYKCLSHKAIGSLLVRQFVGHQGPKGLHRNVDGRVQNPQKPGRHPKGRRIRNEKEGQGAQHRSEQKIRTATPKPGTPGAVREVANDGLHQQARQGCGNPEARQFVFAGSKILKDGRHESTLQGKAKLNAQETKTHVPYLPKAKGCFCLRCRCRSLIICHVFRSKCARNCAGTVGPVCEPPRFASRQVEEPTDRSRPFCESCACQSSHLK